MGQPVVVVEKQSRRPGIVRFEANRSLSGMGHESFLSSDTNAHALSSITPSAELARRLFATGRVAGVHVYQNMITVDLAKGFDSEGLQDIVRDLYQYWKPGMVQPTLEELLANMPADAAAAPVESAEDAAASGRDPRIPAHLWERSRLGRERWLAKQG